MAAFDRPNIFRPLPVGVAQTAKRFGASPVAMIMALINTSLGCIDCSTLP